MKGISITWTIENFRSVESDWVNIFPLEWPETKSHWDIGIVVLKRENNRFINITINKNDNIAPLSLIGSIFAVNETFFELKRFESFNFSESQNEMNIFIAPFERIDYEKVCLSNNGSLTLYIKLWESDRNSFLSAEYFLRSTYIQQTCSFQWTIHGQRDWKKRGNYNESSTVIPMDFTEFFNMKLFRMNFKLSIEDGITYVIISANDYELTNSFIQCSYKLKIQRKEGTNQVLLKTMWSKFFDLSHDLRMVTEAEWDYLLTECVIKIEIMVVTPHVSIIEKISNEPNIQHLRKKRLTLKRGDYSNQNLQHCMNNLYKEGEFCDIELRADSKNFPCHKVVLCARSSVFKRMLETNMIEKETNVVNIHDVDSEILGMFLRYLYSDVLEDKSFDSVMKLYAVADKYDVQNLQEKCVNILMSCLSTENICEVLDLADNHQDGDLKEDIISYFSGHAKEIVNSSSWKKLLVNKPLMAAETLQKAVSNIL